MPVFGRPVFKTGTLASSTNTADQVILTFEISPNKSFVLEYLVASVRLTTIATTATAFGTLSIETPTGTKLLTWDQAGPGVGQGVYLELADPLTIQGNSDGKTVVRVVCTPSASTAFTWNANLAGYEY